MKDTVMASNDPLADTRSCCSSRSVAELMHLDARDSLFGLEGNSPCMHDVFEMVRKIAPSNASVLIGGESGTGKTELARAIHGSSPRASGPFVSLSCASLSETLLESELFGHEKGAFTGAERRRIGRFEQAHQGTLFLDEIGDISPTTQVKLLNVLQDRELQRVGGNETIRVDVRVIAATHRNLSDLVKRGVFRADVYYRLNVVHIEMPPLRERGHDVALLAQRFLVRFVCHNAKSVRGFTCEAWDAILRYPWPGNVRELENAVERAVVLCDGAYVTADHLPANCVPTEESDDAGIKIPGTSLASMERYLIINTFKAVGGSTSRAAAILQISPRTLQQRLQQYGLARGRGRPRSDAPAPPDANPGKSGFALPAVDSSSLPPPSRTSRK